MSIVVTSELCSACLDSGLLSSIFIVTIPDADLTVRVCSICDTASEGEDL